MTHRQLCNIYISSCSKDGGVYCYRLYSDGMTELVDFTPMDRPMYTVISDNKLYVLLRAPFDGSEDSGLVVYDIGTDGKLLTPSDAISTKGKVACHLCVDGKNVYCANYISGSVIKLPDNLVEHTGKGVNAARQEGPHTHFIDMTDDKKHICVVDLGIDTVFMYDKELKPVSKVKLPDGYGPRHLAFNREFLYCANELKQALSVLRCDGRALEYIDSVSLLPEGVSESSAASAIRIRNDFCYVANRFHNSISVFDISSGMPRLVDNVACGGKSPRDFNIIGDILVCANEQSDNVSFFRIVKGIPRKIENELLIKSAFCIAY